MNRMRPLVLLMSLVAVTAFAPQRRVTVWLIGDSTMADKPDPAHNPERGWGQALPEFLDSGAVVHNAARNGRSTKSFIAEGRWDSVRVQLAKGDYVLIEFGHNDEKVEDSLRFTNPYTGYRHNLERFVRESRAAGATPIVLTPIVRRSFNAHGVLVESHGAYPLVARDVARDLGAGFIDLEELTEALVTAAGPDGSKALYVYTSAGQFPAFPAARQDDTHLSPGGASAVARLAAQALAALGGPLARHVVHAEPVARQN